MEFSFDDGQELFKRSARQFLDTYCAKSVLRELEASDSGFSASIWKGMADLGWMGVVVPSEYGGLESSLLELAVLFEEIGRAALPSPFLSNTTATLALLASGTEQQKKTYLPAIVRGELIFTTAFPEPEVNYDNSMISARAVQEGDHFVITGTKRFVSYASVADHLLVAARTAGNPGDQAGITLFVVDRQTPGIRLSPMKTIGGDRQFEVRLENVSVPAANVLGDTGGGFALMENVEKAATALLSVQMVGSAQKEIDMTADYVKVRQQFDRPIGSFQAVQHRAADMFIDVNGARLVAYRAIWRLSENLEADREIAVAKYFANKAIQRVAFSAQHLHGGIGVTTDYDLYFYYRMAKAYELQLGSHARHLRKLGQML